MASDAATETVPAHVLERRLAVGLTTLGIEASEVQQEQLFRFLSMLAKWNGVYNLTSVRDPADMLAVHLLDSLSLLATIDALAPQVVLDVGSGAGLPAIPLSIMRPELEMIAVDAVSKKIGFQLQVKAELELAGLHPVHARVEALRPARPPQVVVSRAYAEIDRMIESIEHVAGADTTVVAMKGRLPGDELARVPAGWAVRETRALEVPFLGAERCAVILGRVPGPRRP